MKKLAYILMLVCQLSLGAWAQPSFVIQKIDIQGLQRISPDTVKSYLPVKRGQTLKPGQTASIVRALYKTGFFEHITLSRNGGTLIIQVIERPTIGQLKIKGNAIIPTDKLTSVMKSLDVVEGRVYDAAILEKIQKSLLNQYYQQGYYNARVEVKVSPMPRDRVMVMITISEGLVAKIRRITLIGNHAFDENTLVKQLDMTPVGLITFYTQTDRYSEEKLDESLQKLRNYYLDHGYVRFEVRSAQGEVTPDRKSVYINMIVKEGQPYTIKGYQLKGQLLLPRKDYDNAIKMQPGDVFSRQKIMDAEKEMTRLLGEQGYMFASIGLHPDINDKTHEVFVTFEVKPGKRVYVRHITFSDNNRTNDDVLRREITQWEAAPASTVKLDDAKHRLSLLPYIRNVDMSVKPVPDEDDEVDVNYKVKEDSSAQATAKLGYSQLYGTMLGAGINQKNFFGTGNTLGLNFSRSQYEQFYGIDYTDPYYTIDGISRSFNLSLSRVDPKVGTGVTNGYTTNEYDAGVLYGIPVGQEMGVYSRIQAGLGYQNVLVNLISGNVSNQVNDFVMRHGRRFQEMDLKLGFSRDSRDKAVFATSGTWQTLFLDTYLPLSGDSLTFYTLNYQGKWYQPLIADQYIVLSKANLGYGNGLHGVHDFPFFRNYFAGGIDSVRGYQGYALGPLDSKGLAMGGNMLADASVALIFPNHLSDSLRTSAFVDAGNVYTLLNNRGYGGESTDAGPIRYSVGLEADILTPFGPIELSLAKSLNKQHKNEGEAFQFSLGANF
ncbi:MAG: outer membrane protein assembly factor BamA [Gammaproteobacteria bacterium RIFCSPHIGHO2_12_FULL_45_12]|nr:MAG: outer membrane protein assembly factor BamA [Gammaproteobacteria bacterium RIFCSPHIGHO2_12_FULL_45_12]